MYSTENKPRPPLPPPGVLAELEATLREIEALRAENHDLRQHTIEIETILHDHWPEADWLEVHSALEAAQAENHDLRNRVQRWRMEAEELRAALAGLHGAIERLLITTNGLPPNWILVAHLEAIAGERRAAGEALGVRE